MPGRAIPSSDRSATLRLSLLAAWTLALGVVLLAASLLLLPLPAARRRARRVLARCWARGVARLLGVTILSGDPAPRAPFLLATNHLGYLDVIVLLAGAATVFVAKAEVRRWPLLGLLARATGTVFIDRARPRDTVRVLHRIRRSLEHGEGIVLFPEGTSTDGADVLPLKPALLDAAAREGVPVHYAVLAYETPPHAPPAAEAVCWWGTMTFGPHLLRLARLPAITARIRWGAAPLTGTDRKSLAVRLHRHLQALHTTQQEPSWSPI